MSTDPLHNGSLSPDGKVTATIEKALRAILELGQVTELRVLEASTGGYSRPHVESGYFDDPKAMAVAAAGIDKAKGFYFVPNPVNPDLLARANNRIRPAGKEPTTSDADVTARRWLLIDIDPNRPTGISSSDSEHEAALTKTRSIRDALEQEGWASPILADSGNGAHLLYRIDLPSDDGGLVKRCLEALAFRFDDEEVTIDQSVHNPARIWKLYGTIARKGDDVPDRPHRLSQLIEVPESLVVVSKETLECLASSVPLPPKTERGNTQYNGGKTFDLDQWLSQHISNIDGPTPWKDGRKWVFPICPWNSDHTNRSAYIVQLGSGAIAAGCRHDSCRDNDWHCLRDTFEPGWREKHDKTGAFSASVAYGAGEQSEESDNQDQLATDTSWPEPPDPAAYHGLAGDIVRAIEPHSEADPVALLVQFFVAFGNAIGRHHSFTADGADHSLNLYAVLVGRTSKGRKGTSWSHIRRTFQAVSPEWETERIQSGLSSGEGLIWAVRDPITKREPIKERGKFTGEYQEIEIDPGVEDKRLLVFEAEFASVLKVLGREGNTLSAIIRGAWETGNIRTLTKNSPAKATGAHISIVGHVTREELRRYLSTTEAASGFGNRFLWVCVKRSKCLPDGGKINTVDFASLNQRLKDALEFAGTAESLRRDDDARAIWHGVYPNLSEGKPGLLGAMIGRAEAQVMRLACLYALLDLSPIIRSEHMLAALALWEFCEASVRHIFGASLGDPVADDILKALKATPAGMTRSEIRDLFKRHRSAGQVGLALATLVEHGLAHREMEKTSGRPAERWFYCPPQCAKSDLSAKSPPDVSSSVA